MKNIEKGILLSYIGYKLKTPLQNTIGSNIFLKNLLKSQSPQCIVGISHTPEYHSEETPSTSEYCLTDCKRNKNFCIQSEEIEKYINIIEQSNSENISIINNIIDYSKLLLNKSKTVNQ